ncbi:MAG: 50S ribosomal protein L5 [Patescibacteria group bacterium]
MEHTQQKIKHTFSSLKVARQYKNPMQAPRLVKVIVSVGIGSVSDQKKKDLIKNRLTRITGQMPITRGAKKSISSFKVREGDPVGYQVTLRGKRMFDFLDRLLHIALPRTKDFRGVSLSGIDEMGNYTLGVRAHTIFPETSDEELKDVFGMAVTIVTTASGKEEAKDFLAYLGFPFAKVVERKSKDKKVVKK